MKNIKFVIIALIFLVVGFFAGQSYQLNPVVQNSTVENKEQQELSDITISIKFDENNIREIQNLIISQDQTVLDLLTKVAEENDLAFKTQDYGDLGMLVTQIGDKVNGQNNKYWQYYINGEFAAVGADQYKLTGKERIEWQFSESEF
ncbi:DUF4430 domain-containing protein [Patescibacteria group bacterium]|nr:DUF4430 domain-containing protein [Patescibacteria group bacterium]